MASTRVLVYVQRKGTDNKPYLAIFTQVIPFYRKCNTQILYYCISITKML